MREPAFDHILAPFASLRGNRIYLREFEFAAESVDHRQEHRFPHAIDFIEEKKDRAFEAPDPFQRERVAGTEIRGGVGNEREHIDAFERLRDFVHHLAIEDAVRLVNSGCIDEHNLCINSIEDALNAIARGLRARRDDGDLTADERIYERRFARVGPAYDCDESGFEGHVKINSTPNWSRFISGDCRLYVGEKQEGSFAPLRMTDFFCAHVIDHGNVNRS